MNLMFQENVLHAACETSVVATAHLSDAFFTYCRPTLALAEPLTSVAMLVLSA